MKFLKYSILSLLIIFSIFASNKIFAEDVKNNVIDNKSDSITVVAEVNIQNFKIVSQEGNVFKISFDLTNGKGIQSGVKYGIKLIGQNDKGKFVVDEKVYPEEITLYENSKVSKEVTYTAPLSAGGEFVLMAESKNSSGFPFALSYSDKITLTPKAEGVQILSDTCKLSIKDEQIPKVYTLNQGVDINLGEILTLSCDVQNFSKKESIVTPNYETTYRTTYGNVVPAKGGTLESVTLKSQGIQNLLLELPKAKNPQAYDVKVSLKNGEEISNEVVVHYVLRGNSATINNISLDKDYYTKGDIAQLSFVWSGQADIFPGNRSGIKGFNQNTVTAQILNNKGNECSDVVEQSINAGSPNPKIEIPINIKSDCKDPTVSLTLKDSNGNVIAEQSLVFKTNSNNTKNISFLYYILVTLIIIGLAIYIKVKKNKNKENTPNGISFHVIFPLLALIALGSIFPAHFAKADTFILGDSNGVHANFLVNVDGLSYDYQQVSSGQVLKFDASVTMAACENASNTSSTATITYDGNTKDILDKTASITAPSTDGQYSYTLNLTYKSGDLNLSKSVTRYFYIQTTGHDGACFYSYAPNDPYRCQGMSTVIDKTQVPSGNDLTVATTWTWKCKATDSSHSDSGTCTLKSTIENGDCLANPDWDPNWYNYSSYDKSDLGCSPGKKVNFTQTDKQYWQCVGLYGGTTDETCSAPLVVKCGDTIGSCINGTERADSRNIYDGKVQWYCENANSLQSCGPISIGDTFVTNVSGDCPIGVEDNSCGVNAYWKYYNNTGDHNFKICVTNPSKCISLNTDTVTNEGSSWFGGMYAYGAELSNTSNSILISLKSISDEVYNSETIYPNCSYSYDYVNNTGGPTRWNGIKCVRDGGWSNPSDWSTCSVNYCTYGQTGIIKGVKTKTKTCTSPAPSASGNACVGSATETRECSIDCSGATTSGAPSSPKIEIEGGTGNENSVTLATGESQTFYFYSSDYESDPNNEKIRYGVDWDYYDSANPLYGFWPYQWKYFDANGVKQQTGGYSKPAIGDKYNGEIADDWNPAVTSDNKYHFTFPTNSQFYKKEQNRGVFTHTWNKTGTYVLRGITANYASKFSANWTPFTVNVVAGAWLNLTTTNPIIEKGKTAKLDWKSDYMESCSADFKPGINSVGDGYINPSGTSEYSVDLNGGGWVKPDVTTTYSVTCKPNSLVSNKTPIKKSITIQVNEIIPEEAVGVSLISIDPITSAPVSDILEGQLIVLKWNSSNASYCESQTPGFDNYGKLSGATPSVETGVGAVKPTVPTTYTIKCGNSYGDKSASIKVNVIQVCTDLSCPIFCKNNPDDSRCKAKPKPIIIEI